MKNTVAKTAAAIRADLKAIGIKASVQSKNYSGGDSVTVNLPDDMHKDDVSKIREMLSKYEAGSFDGMTDLYTYDNTRGELATKYLFINAEISDETAQTAWAILIKMFGELKDAPADLSVAQNDYFIEFARSWPYTFISKQVKNIYDKLGITRKIA